MRTRIIGVGNPLRGGDGIGRVAAQFVLERGAEHVSVRAVPQLTPELAATFSEHDRVIIIDANA